MGEQQNYCWLGKRKGSSINDVHNWEGGGVKNWLILTIKNDNMGEWDVENPEKLPTSFMDGPKEEGRQNNGKLSRLSTTEH